MRRITLASLALLALASSTALAQGDGPGGRRRDLAPPQSGQGLFRDITLSAQQQQKVDSIWQAQAPQRRQQAERMRAMREGGERPDSAARQQMMAARQSQWAALRGVLTAEQQKTFDRNTAEMRERMGQAGGRRGGAPGGGAEGHGKHGKHAPKDSASHQH